MPNLANENINIPHFELNKKPKTEETTKSKQNEDLEISALDAIAAIRIFLIKAQEVHKQNIKLKKRNEVLQSRCDALKQQIKGFIAKRIPQ